MQEIKGEGAVCPSELNKIKGSTHTAQHRVEEHCQAKTLTQHTARKGEEADKHNLRLKYLH